MKDKVLDAYKNKKLIGIYTDSINPNSFSVGYILHADENSYILYNISPYGKFDGYSCELVEDIIKIEEDSKYLNNIQKLINYYKLDVVDEMLFDDSKPIVFNFIEFIKSSNSICSILTDNSDIYDIVGFIKKYNKKSIEILQIDSDSYEDGIIKINIDNIEKIVCSSNDEKKLEILYKLNNKYFLEN
ncbi:MAG: hypothetical protein PUH11_00360 [Bacilli bacterium]|nr:hypothetical protein [Bacilli bacterium]MDY4052599.1 hypothetical protein [Bacilli bacterium]